MADYLRQMPHQGSHDMARSPGIASRFHIDVPLLLLLILLLVLLYITQYANIHQLLLFLWLLLFLHFYI